MNETGRKKKKEKKTGKRKDEEGQMNERKNVSKKKVNRISPEIPMIIILSLLYYFF